MHIPLRYPHTPLHPQLRTTGSLFTGIGGIDLGLEQAGCGTTMWQVELDAYCRRVLERHWPLSERHTDVRTVGKQNLSRVDLLCGGFPCQDTSLAGKRKGLRGKRSGLWFENRRIIQELEPRAVVIENVLGLRTAGLPRVLADLARLGFDAEWSDLAAVDVGAPHIRRRLFIVATHPDRITVRRQPGWLRRACWQVAAEHRLDPARVPASDADGVGRLERARQVACERGWAEHCGWELALPARVDDGVSGGVHRRRAGSEAARKALGNAVNVVCARVIGAALLDAITPEEERRSVSALPRGMLAA